MKFMLTHAITPERRNAAIDRFLATGGAPPKAVELNGTLEPRGHGRRLRTPRQR